MTKSTRLHRVKLKTLFKSLLLPRQYKGHCIKIVSSGFEYGNTQAASRTIQAHPTRPKISRRSDARCSRTVRRHILIEISTSMKQAKKGEVSRSIEEYVYAYTYKYGFWIIMVLFIRGSLQEYLSHSLAFKGHYFCIYGVAYRS